MRVFIVDGQNWRGKAHFSKSLNVAFISSDVDVAERDSLLNRLKQSKSNTIWR